MKSRAALSIKSLIVLSVIGTVSFNIYTKTHGASFEYNTNTELVQAFNKETEKAALVETTNKVFNNEIKTQEYKIEMGVYEQMHKLANSLIVSVDGEVWGEEKITKESVRVLKEKVEKNNNLFGKAAYSEIMNIISRWEKSDYSQGVEDHNYVWKQLGGSIGRAKELREEYRK
ncbi:DUF6241 domain-containing protein [Clostridium swellfunianum]|uniref:DUF6241 domain-containing protein n=1 Tax=Clostridium swellfunianum TaxID=1367462 RepID=UPI00202F4966|nr:DUF6241 domain-containing protein [Clostridium swellfunianum]MCM0649050.1 DUF6241 domain-containing protein [Clostridium swellfunianum]